MSAAHDPVVSLLARASRVFERPVHLRSPSADRTWALHAVRETSDTLTYTAETAAQAFRQVVWTYDADALPLVEGGYYIPRRGDILTAGDERFKVVEAGGVTCTHRFENGMTRRMMMFTEQC
ncbi:MAG: hypothetical protein ACOX6D_02590 [Thermoguttaceae bacterium]|jgi:hypothetical protein